MLKYCKGFLSTFATLGRKVVVRRPSVSGRPRRMKIVFRTSIKGITS